MDFYRNLFGPKTQDKDEPQQSTGMSQEMLVSFIDAIDDGVIHGRHPSMTPRTRCLVPLSLHLESLS